MTTGVLQNTVSMYEIFKAIIKLKTFLKFNVSKV